MILLLAVTAGLLAGLVWAWRQRAPYEVPTLHHLWLVFVAFLPQYMAIYLPARGSVPNWAVVLCLIISQLLLFGFALLNRHHQGMKILMIGAFLNFMVMSANGGFMPVGPQTASRLVSQNVVLNMPIGSRFGNKDILLPPEQTRLEWLADRFLPPVWSPYQVAFSLGDVFIAAGAFWLLAKQGNKQVITHDRSNYVSTVRQS
jgi:hypothetical protein